MHTGQGDKATESPPASLPHVFFPLQVKVAVSYRYSFHPVERALQVTGASREMELIIAQGFVGIHGLGLCNQTQLTCIQFYIMKGWIVILIDRTYILCACSCTHA